MNIRSISPILVISLLITSLMWGIDELIPNRTTKPIKSNRETNRLYQQVLGETVVATPVPTDNFVASNFDFVQESPIPQENKKVKVALLGDSMIDTLGNFDSLKILLEFLKKDHEWEIINYGVGSSNAGYGLYRVTNKYDYQGKHYQSLLEENPDIIIVESFAYNHGDMTEGKYQDTLKRIFETLKQNQKRVILLATIAPSKANYARGAVDWSDEYRSSEYEKTRRFMDLSMDAARQSKVEIVNAFHASFDGDKGGNEKYINKNDWIHPSPEGAEFIASLLAPVIISLVD